MATNPLTQTARVHHFVPQVYLRNWTSEGKRIWTYSLLVPHMKHPLWAEQSIRGVAAREHLYTSVLGNDPPDAFERWLNEAIETPAGEVLKKVAADQPLHRSELDRLIRFAAALDRRTPASYLEDMARWEKTLPSIIEGTLSKARAKLERAARTGKKIKSSAPPPVDRPIPFRLKIREPTPGSDLYQVRAEVTAGRELWLHSIEHAVKHTADALLRHKWSIVRPHPKTEWFTSDHPVLRLKFYAGGRYDFGGGWGRKGSEFILPLSPKHLLYTKVGSAFPPEFTMGAKETLAVQRFLAERAFRTIFAPTPMPRASWFRSREVDLARFKAEQEQWHRWHSEQSGALNEGV